MIFTLFFNKPGLSIFACSVHKAPCELLTDLYIISIYHVCEGSFKASSFSFLSLLHRRHYALVKMHFSLQDFSIIFKSVCASIPSYII